MGGSIGPKGKYERVPKRQPGSSSASLPTDGGADNQLPKSTDATTPRGSVTDALKRLASRDDGWLRLSPDGDRKTVYIKWKFTCNQFANKYVMVLVGVDEVAWGLELLDEKIYEAYVGVLKPSEDHWFKHL